MVCTNSIFYSRSSFGTIRVFAMLAGLYYLGHRMNTGKTLFAQVMEYVPWKTFGRIIERHNGDSGVRTLSCADVFRVMAWRNDLARIAARHRGVPHFQSNEAVSHGHEERSRSLDFGRCLEFSGLAHLSRAGHAPDCECQGTLRQRAHER